MSLPRYESYKDSGVEWLGEVPKHWEVKSVKNVATCNDNVLSETTIDDYQIEYVDISSVDSVKGIAEITTMPFSEAPSRARRRVQNGDILVSTVRTYLRAITPVRNPPENLIVSTGFAVLRPKSISSSYLGYVFQTEYLISEVISRSVGISYPAINASELIRIYIPLPLIEEQATIANFLEQETAKIDNLIAEQQQLIKLLKEKRQAVISHAVTKGLNPDVPMKDSGVEWLGEVPEHWDVKRLKYKFRLLTEKTTQSENTIALENIESWTGRFIYTESLFEGSGVNFDNGDILFGKLRPYLAKVFHCENEGEAIGDFFVLRPSKDTNSQFAQYQILNSDFIAIVDSSTYGTKMPRVNWEFFSNMVISSPPVDEQQQINLFLKVEISKFENLDREAKSIINLLKERRSALISSAVTGKIDVRNYVSTQPQVEAMA